MIVEITPGLLQKIDATHDTVIEIKTVLLGKNGDTGLVGKVKKVCDGHEKLHRNFWILVTSLVASGLIGTGIFGLLK